MLEIGSTTSLHLFHLVTLVAGRAQCSNMSNVFQCILLLSSQLPLPLKHSVRQHVLLIKIYFIELKDIVHHLGP
jgi:hypothetical protein